MMVSTCTTFCIEVPHHLAYEIFTFTAHYQILTGPSQLTLPKRNVRYLVKGQARGMILASLFCILNNTMIGWNLFVFVPFPDHCLLFIFI